MDATTGLLERVHEALKQSPIPAIRRISIEPCADRLVLHGRVPSYYYKQLAQETVLPHLAGRPLQNDLEVVRP